MTGTMTWQSRHTVLAVIFFTCVVSYTDRMAMAVAIPYIAADFHLSPVAMGVVMSSFFATYALSQIPGGLLADRFGVRKVATTALLWWSAFTAVTGAVVSLPQMLVARLFFGLGEGVYPACAFKAVAMSFPQKERGTANAVMLSSGPIGAALAPLIVVWLIADFGWRAVFYSLAVPGVLMAFLLWKLIPSHDRHRANGDADTDMPAAAAAPAAKVGLRDILRQPNILQFIFVYFFFDIAYWGLTNWLPTYLVKARHFSMLEMGVAAALPQVVGVAGTVFGGWVSDRYFQQRRRIPIVISQIVAAICLYLTFTTTSLALVVVYQIVAGFFLNAFFSAFWAIPMNTVPVALMGTTTGVINMAGQTAAFISPILIGYILQLSGGAFAGTFVLLIACLLLSCAAALCIVRGAPAAIAEPGPA